jgi:hypothetical protein
MQIESAQYIVDANGNNLAVDITHDDGQVCSCPVDGTTWINGELNAFVAAGGVIAAGVPPTGE